MVLPIQPPLLELPEQPVAAPARPCPQAPPKLKPIDRSQSLLRTVIVEELVPPDHKVRAIWDLSGQLDLSRFRAKIVSREGPGGRAAWDPRLLLSIWLYAYSEQITSAREIERLMEYEPGLMWLAGLGEVNHHTLSDFRAGRQEELKKLLAELLGVLSQEGFVKLELVAHDGTRIRAQAGADSFRREGTLEKEIAKATQVVEELERQTGTEQEGGNSRREAAQRRAARQRLERMEQAAEELKKIREGKKSEQERMEARVSLTEPEARVMKHGDNAFAPSYNVPLTTDAENKIIVGVHVTQSSSDSGSLLPAMEEVKATMGQYPEQAVADAGFTTQKAIEEMKEKQIDFYGSLPDAATRQTGSMKAAGIDPAFGPSAFVVIGQKESLQCPAGKILEYVRQSKKRDDVYHQYQAQGSDCSNCEFQKQCCPKHAEQGRTVSVRMTENADVARFRDKMKGEDAKQIYRQRGAVAEFPNCWLKEKLGLRKFRMRGLFKATTEAIWGVVTYDAMQWIRLSWKPKLSAQMAA
jgi:transposase